MQHAKRIHRITFYLNDEEVNHLDTSVSNTCQGRGNDGPPRRREVVSVS